MQNPDAMDVPDRAMQARAPNYRRVGPLPERSQLYVQVPRGLQLTAHHVLYTTVNTFTCTPSFERPTALAVGTGCTDWLTGYTLLVLENTNESRRLFPSCFLSLLFD